MSRIPLAARPGTTYLVPEARIRRLNSALRADAETGEELNILAGDVLQVSVMRVHSGTSQYSITVNNWFDSLPQRRRDEGDESSRPEPLENGRPAWPRFKYNTLQHLRFGDRLRIDMRYCGDRPNETDPAAGGAQAWVPMIAGPVTDMRFTFSSGEGSRVTISGEDDLSRLKDKSQGKAEFSRLSERSIVSRVLERVGYPLPIAKSLVEWPSFAEDDSRGLSETLQGGQSTLDFLNKLADRLDFEVFVEFDRLDMSENGVAVTFHFEPARSLTHPDAMPGTTYVLHREKQLIDFAPTIKVIDQYSENRGQRPPSRPQPARAGGTAEPAARRSRRTCMRHPEDPPLLSGPAIRPCSSPIDPTGQSCPTRAMSIPNGHSDSPTPLSARRWREPMTIEATTIGLPRLRPGQHVEIRGFRSPFDGFYYVTRTVHSYGTDGFRTRISAVPAGMPARPAGRHETWIFCSGYSSRRRCGAREQPVLGLVTARVLSVQDDGTCLLDYLTMGSDEPSAPARVMMPMAGANRGMHFFPEPGDEVIVAFELGDTNLPVILGGVWNSESPPPGQAQQSPANHVRTIVSRSGHEVTFDDTPGAERLVVRTSGGHELTLNDAPVGGQVALRTAGGHELLLQDTPPGNAVLRAASGAQVEMNGASGRLTVSAPVGVEISSPGILTLRATAIQLVTTGNVTGSAVLVDGMPFGLHRHTPPVLPTTPPMTGPVAPG